MTQTITNVSTLGTHTRVLVTTDKPFIASNLLPNSSISISCDANATTLVEVSLSHSSLEPAFIPAAVDDAGVVSAGTRTIEEIRCKLAAVRATVTGTGTATVETLQ